MILEFAKGLPLPTDAVTQKFAFLGRTGSGKSYAARKLVESLLKLRAQVVILDPVGTWHGLRAGDRVSFDIPVLGGLHGDLPLAPTAGAVVARIVCERSTSMVLDVSQMHDAERTRFSEAFAHEFFQLKKAAPSPVMLVLEEMQEFAPQNPNPGEQMMLHEFQRIAKLGRNFGIGLLGISQRPQECAKKVLNQTECVVAFQMTGPQERKALEYWLSDRGIEANDLGKLLPTLEIGKPLLWSPQWLKKRQVVEILPIETSDTSRTPQFGSVASTFELRPIDISALKEKLAEATESVAKDDPKALRARIKELELVIAAGAGPTAAPVVVFDKKKAEKLRDSYDQHLARTQQLLQWEHSELREIFDRIEKLHRNATLLEQHLETNTLAEDLGAFLDDLRATTSPKATFSVSASAATETPAPKPPTEPRKRAAVGGIPPGEVAMLGIVMQKKGGATDAYVILCTGYRRGSVSSYASRLSSRGLITRAGSRSFATAQAFETMPAPEPLPTGGKLIEHYVATLPPGEALVVSCMYKQLGRPIDTDKLVKLTGRPVGSVTSYVSRLRTREIVVGKGHELTLNPELSL